jgi:hypothetical protein
MTVREMAETLHFGILDLPHGELEVSGVYTGDLLSWVMGHIKKGNVWITVISNFHTVAVATITNASCILLADGVQPEKEMRLAAAQHHVNLLTSDMNACELSAFLTEQFRKRA